MIVSVCYLLLFLFVGLLLARRAVPDADSAVLLPLGCGLGVSLLAVLPALFALPLYRHSKLNCGADSRFPGDGSILRYIGSTFSAVHPLSGLVRAV